MRTLLILILANTMAFAAAEESLTVLTYNIHHGEGTDGEVDLDRIAGIIRAQNPDVVCLQEVDQNLPRTAMLDMPDLLSKKLGMDVVFGGNYAFDNGLYGNATLTKLPILESENRELPNPKGAEPRGYLRVRVAKGGHTVDVFNTHLGLDPDERKEQAGAIVDIVREFPAVLAGDLNAEPPSTPIEILRAVFRDTFLGDSATASTLPGARTPRRIDYVLVTRHITIESSDIITEGDARVASDHLPYVARVSLGSPPETLSDKGIPWNDDARIGDAVLEDNP